MVEINKLKKLLKNFEDVSRVIKGGSGYGNFGHAGRPGEVGGSGDGGSGDGNGSQGSKDTIEQAKSDLEKELGGSLKESGDYGFGEGKIFTNGDEEYVVFANTDKAEQAAIEQVKNDLEDDPSLFNQDFLQHYVEVSDNDKNIIAQEEADSQVEGMEDSEILDKADMQDQYDSQPEDDGKEEILDKAKEQVSSDIADEIENKLSDPINYFVDEQGIYSREDLLKQPFIRINISDAAKDAVDQDGIAHFISTYDGNEITLENGGVAYRTN